MFQAVSFNCFVYLFLAVCGSRIIISSKIVGGNQSSAGKWPWQALIRSVNRQSGSIFNLCGGSILNTKWILTSIHCTKRLISFKLRFLRVFVFFLLNQVKICDLNLYKENTVIVVQAEVFKNKATSLLLLC